MKIYNIVRTQRSNGKGHRYFTTFGRFLKHLEVSNGEEISRFNKQEAA